jgi:hypothetical protein
MTRRLVSWSAGQPLPRNADRRTLAAIITSLFFPVSPRTLEKWPLQVTKVNGAAISATADAIAIAEAKLAAARTYKLGTGRPTVQATCGSKPLTLTVQSPTFAPPVDRARLK